MIAIVLNVLSDHASYSVAVHAQQRGSISVLSIVVIRCRIGEQVISAAHPARRFVVLAMIHNPTVASV